MVKAHRYFSAYCASLIVYSVLDLFSTNGFSRNPVKLYRQEKDEMSKNIKYQFLDQVKASFGFSIQMEKMLLNFHSYLYMFVFYYAIA